MKTAMQIIRNNNVNYLYDVVTIQNDKGNRTIVEVHAEGVSFPYAQTLMGVDPDEVVLDDEGDVV